MVTITGLGWMVEEFLDRPSPEGPYVGVVQVAIDRGLNKGEVKSSRLGGTTAVVSFYDRGLELAFAEEVRLLQEEWLCHLLEVADLLLDGRGPRGLSFSERSSFDSLLRTESRGFLLQK